MKYKVLKSQTTYAGFLQLSEGMVCRCSLGTKKSHENERGKVTSHFSATLDEPCEYILAREGESERLIRADVGSLIGIREIPPLRDLSNLPEGTHIELRLLGTSYFNDDKLKPRHDIQISIAEE